MVPSLRDSFTPACPPRHCRAGLSHTAAARLKFVIFNPHRFPEWSGTTTTDAGYQDTSSVPQGLKPDEFSTRRTARLKPRPFKALSGKRHSSIVILLYCCSW